MGKVADYSFKVLIITRYSIDGSTSVSTQMEHFKDKNNALDFVEKTNQFKETVMSISIRAEYLGN